MGGRDKTIFGALPFVFVTFCGEIDFTNRITPINMELIER